MFLKNRTKKHYRIIINNQQQCSILLTSFHEEYGLGKPIKIILASHFNKKYMYLKVVHGVTKVQAEVKKM
jgi:hypothetical protein